MDDNGSGVNEGVIVGLLPMTTDWCKQDFPHMTLVYAGKVSEHGPSTFNELAKDAAALAMMNRPINVRVKGTSVFGDGTQENPLVDVLLLEPTSEIMAMRRTVEQWDASDYSSFRPHATIGPRGSSSVIDIPPMLCFDRIIVCFGEDALTFLMRSSY